MTRLRAQSSRYWQQLTNPDCGRISPQARIAPGVEIGAGVVIGPEVEVGECSTIGPNVVVQGRVRIGAHVRIGPGTVVGADGFGYEFDAGTWNRLEHAGRIVIEDDVDIGANVTVARAKSGRETRIGRGTKIDCLVHVAHNVRIGAHCVIAAQTGVAGSAVIGDRVRIAGQVGISDHVRVGNDVVLYARSAVFRSVPDGAHYSGIPARPHSETRLLWARLMRRFVRGA